MTKYELTISTNYVPEWTYVEALRELFQNALDQQIENPDNGMVFDYNPAEGIVTIANKTSSLKLESLLLGATTKADNNATIGQHGEGYKIAFMVLLREGKKIIVHNFGLNQEWEVRLVKSRRFGGCLVPTVFVEKKTFWNKVPDHDLTIEIIGITSDEWEEIETKNLHLKRRNKAVVEYETNIGRILLDEDESGRIYVKGLYVCTNPNFKYGYDFEPSQIQLDRDRKLIGDSNLSMKTSALWSMVFQRGFMQEEIKEMIRNSIADVKAIQYTSCTETNLKEMLAEDFLRENEGCYPVCWYTPDETLEKIDKAGLTRKSVPDTAYSLLTQSSKIEALLEDIEVLSLEEKFREFLEKIRSKLNAEEIEEFETLIDEVDG